MTTACGPRWRVDLPRSWRVRRGAGFVAAATAPGAHPAVMPLVVVGHERLPAELALRALAASATEHLAGLTDAVEDLGSTGGVGPPARWVQVLAFTARQPRAEVALVLALVAPNEPDADGARDVIQVVATCALDDLPRHGPVFVGVVESVRAVARP